MNTYYLSVYFLFTASLCEAVISGFTLKSALQSYLPTARRRMWAAFSVGAMLLALQYSCALSLAAQTGLYDFRQATLALLGALATTFAVWQLRRLKP